MTKTTEELKISIVPIDSINPYENNARKHSEKQIQQIANSINQFGFINPIVIDDKGEIIAGHGRVEAAKLLKLKNVPVIKADHLTEAEIKAYRITDNKTTDNSSFDNKLLKIDLAKLSISTEFDIGVTGFETAEIDIILDNNVTLDKDSDDEVPEIDDSPVVTQLGDIWQLGNHMVICGDAKKPETYQGFSRNFKADAVITDPPYNVKIDGHVGGNGKIKHREFVEASGEMSDEEFYLFLRTACENMAMFSKDGSLHYIWMDWRNIDTLLKAGKSVYTSLKNICVWNKDNGGMGSLYRSKHEFIAVFKHGTKPHTNNIELGKYGRYRTSVWDYKGVNSFGKNQKDLKMHPTVKPVAMLADAIKDCTKRGDSVLDPFAGSGSTLIAAERTGRIAYCIELDPKYCDVIIRRWQDMTGDEAYHTDSLYTFNELSTL